MFTLESFFTTLLLFLMAHGVTESSIKLVQEFRAPDVDTSAITDGIIELAFRLGASGLLLTSVIIGHPVSSQWSPFLEAVRGIVFSILCSAFSVFVLIESEKLWRLTNLHGRKLLPIVGAQLLVYILLFLAVAL